MVCWLVVNQSFLTPSVRQSSRTLLRSFLACFRLRSLPRPFWFDISCCLVWHFMSIFVIWFLWQPDWLHSEMVQFQVLYLLLFFTRLTWLQLWTGCIRLIFIAHIFLSICNKTRTHVNLPSELEPGSVGLWVSQLSYNYSGSHCS